MHPSHRRAMTLFPALVATIAAAAIPAVAAAEPTINEYSLNPAGLQPSGIVTGPDGNLWFGEQGTPNGVGVSSPSGAESRFTSGFTGVTEGVAVGEDGNLWFTEPKANALVRVTPLGVATVYPVSKEPTAITAGPDGDIWFTETADPGAIGRIDPSNGEISVFPTPTTNTKPLGIAAGCDGNLWFTESGGNGAIGRISTEGEITEFTAGLAAKSQPTGIAAGPDGNLWFTQPAANGAIGRITTEGEITEFTTGLTAKSQPTGIAAADDGVMYFTELAGTGRIGAITTEGTITETAVPTANNKPEGIAVGPEGNVWFTESGASAKVAVMTVAPGVQDSEATPVGEHLATLNASISPNAQATEYSFEYGPSSSYGSTTPTESAGSGGTPSTVSAQVEGLLPGSTYHFRVVATNASGTTYGPDTTFTTPVPPSAVSGAASSITASAATLAGSVNPNGSPTTYRFDWGTSPEYGYRAPASAKSAGTGETPVAVNAALSGLAPATTYHFRVVASNCGGCEEGTTYGADQTFTTQPAPSGEGTGGGSSPAAATTTGGAQPGPAPGAQASGAAVAALGSTAVVSPLAGRVLVKRPGAAKAQPLGSASEVPLGSLIDASGGVARLATATDAAGATQSVEVWGSSFRVTQAKAAGGMTTLVLATRPSCHRAAAAGSALAFAARARAAQGLRGLWARDNHGHFSTRGRNSVATVRGTYWGTFETCAGTLTVVRSGLVAVRSLRRHRSVLVRAGHSYLARR